MHSHAADTAIGEIAVQKAPGHCVENLPVWHVDELRMIEGVLSLPSKFQPRSFGDWEHLKIDSEIVGPACV